MTKYLTLLLLIGLGAIRFIHQGRGCFGCKRRREKWLAYTPLALISAGGFATATFFIGEGIYDGDILLPLIIGSGYLVIFCSYYIFNKLDKKRIEDISSENNEDYRNIYLQEFKRRKSENIISSSVLVGLATGLAVLLIIESFSGGMGDYDACFDPRCD